MDTKELLQYQLSASATQVDKVFAGLPGELWSAKTSAGGMTPLEIASHLTECYLAAQKSCKGEEHEWGSYVAPDDDPDAVMASLRSERTKASEELMRANNEKAFKDATQYIVLHDAYHVGQMAALRVEKDVAWDPYSIYS